MSQNSPPSSVTAVRTFSINTGLDASTVTPGKTAPDVSLTTPVMDDCCADVMVGTSTRSETNATWVSLRMTISPLAHAVTDGPVAYRAVENLLRRKLLRHLAVGVN